jgi:ABC-type phosphate/phosphonate transport system substrate-binding protein
VRTAELPWYDFAELRAATDALWQGIARHLRRHGVDDVPDRLCRDGEPATRWRNGRLLLSQACGYDVLHDFADDLVPIATPCYTAPGCDGPRYRSHVLVRSDGPLHGLAGLRGTCVAVNEASSHSGCNALRTMVAPLARNGTFFGEVLQTGSHVQSLQALASGRVDVVCLDVVVAALLEQVRPAAVASLRVVATSASAPAPPYVTSVHTPAPLRRALQEALVAMIADPALADVRRALHLADVALLPPATYDELRTCESIALAAGYYELPAPRRSPLSSARRDRRPPAS